MFFVCKNIRSRKRLLQQQRLRMARYGESSGNYQQDQINIFDHLSPVSISELNNQDDCTICLQKLNDELEVRQTCCHHNFHSLCIKEWLKNNKKECPVCRSNLVPKDGNINTIPQQ
ncbi:unnamed protein product (macronuclear) [Paramecium tetraurelia]|uniref:RING-type domain-containing protein n=1 Tax=Paramecium tetraurelia TaxID=5888 RepID=A0E4U9_PARTE|nr:uncharacterized protein GSPATT00023492001 [Paramecium tetraurelia]CAK90316.1 unnamed protein product [Paramecium tetraurelia]|eukprot:XP_001457713.1 hypothetical protein (macronuclear) [Paramecium tetraurelia strain d4-2]